MKIHKLKKMNGFLKAMTFKNVDAITLAPFGIYVRHDELLNNNRLIVHENIHWQQQMELGIIFFYIWYVLEFFVRLFINGRKAYKNIVFEQECHDNHFNPFYLLERKRYNWFKKYKK